MSAFRHAGGPNSVDSFARSWQRATEFFEITPARHSFRFVNEDEDTEADFKRVDVEGNARNPRSLLRQALESDGRRASEQAVRDDNTHDETTPLMRESVKSPTRTSTDVATTQQSPQNRSSFRSQSVFSMEPSLSSPFGGLYGTSYGSYVTRMDDGSTRYADRTTIERQTTQLDSSEGTGEPLLVKQIEEDGKLVSIIVGQSTLPQTIFNSVNVLIGIGLLSLPLAFKYSGWVIGIPFFVFSAVVTSYTAKVLAQCLDIDVSMVSFADIAYVSFGSKARVAISLLFTLELLATCVALVILFADTLHSLVTGLTLTDWKLVCGVILVPLGFVPLRMLSFTSILGILCCFGSKC